MKRTISIITVIAMVLSMLGTPAYAANSTDTGDVGALANVRVKFVNNEKYGGIDRQKGSYVQSYLPEDELIYEGSVTNVTDETFYIRSIGFYLVTDRFETIDKSNIPTGNINIPVEPHSTYKVEVPVKVKPNITGVIGYTNGFTGTSGNPTSGNSTFYVSGNTSSQGYAPIIASFAANKNIVLYPYADYTLTKRNLGNGKYDVMIGVNEEMNYSGMIPHIVEVDALIPNGYQLYSADLKVLTGSQYNNSKPEIVQDSYQGKTLYRIKCIFWMSGSTTYGQPHLILQFSDNIDPEIFITNQVYKNTGGISKDYVAVDYMEDKCTDIEFALDASAASREVSINSRTVDNASTTYYMPDEDMTYTATVTNNRQYDIQVKNVQIRIPSQMEVTGNNSSTAEGFAAEIKTSNNETSVHFKSEGGVTVKPNEQIHFYVPVHTKADAAGDICYTVYDTGYPLRRLYSANAQMTNPQAIMNYSSASGSGQLYANADLTYKNGLDFAVVMQPQINPSNNQKSAMLKNGETLNIPLKVGTTLAMFLYSKDVYTKSSIDWHSLNIQERLPEWLTLTNSITPYMGYTSFCYEANSTTNKGTYTEFNDKSDSYPYGRYQGSPLILYATVNDKAKIGDTFTFSPHITGKVLAGKEDLSVLSGVGAYPQSGTVIISPYVAGYNVTQTRDTSNIVMQGDTVQYTIHIDADDEEADDLGAVHFAVQLPGWLEFKGEYSAEGMEDGRVTSGNGYELHFYGTMQKHATVTYTAYVSEKAKHGDRYTNTAYATTGTYANSYDTLSTDPSVLSATADEVIVVDPNEVPTEEPTKEPTAEPTEIPTEEPTIEPTAEPTEIPTEELTIEPTAEPTEAPTEEPTAEPTALPTPEPSEAPTAAPTAEPTSEPTVEPTEEPTAEPTEMPTEEPTIEPTAEPTEESTSEPTATHTPEPTEIPTQKPTAEPIEAPIIEATAEPTEMPTEEPTIEPTAEPTTEPTATPIVRRSSGSGPGRPSNLFVPETVAPILTTAEPTTEPTAKQNNSSTVIPQLDRENHYAYIIGYPDGSVRPNAEISRAEVATIFFRMLSDESRAELWSSENTYEDVTTENWYNNAVSTLTNAGIVNGDNDTAFRPNAAITRAEFAAIAARFAGKQYSDKDMFTDISGHWAAEYINTAAKLGWIHGYEDGMFRPDNLITRAEAMTLINNVLDRHGDEMLEDMVTWSDNTDTSAWYYSDIQEATNSHYYNKDNGIEAWTELREPRDWSALETELSTASSAGAEPSIIEGRIFE